ncbi:MAG: DNA polymerase III subunit gamma/tau [Actinomycetota bacterium]
MAYQSLYRRYRPQRFGEIRGQRHVVSALQNAIVKGEVGHAYLFHGPRGTGKTTSARVLAKALNCERLGPDGEPCSDCESCVAIEQGRSFDLHELDAASNNKVEDMRDLLAKVNLGTPGRAKVYILDEVHMLTSQAENALLKTLEEPPDHVTWVLATTEPHKVVETIRSRCQVFQLTLLGAEEMADHVRWVIDDAELDVSEEAVEHVVAAGGGSVRDTLSALDRVVAAGGVVEVDTTTETMIEAISTHDVAGALAAVGDATGRGRDPRTIGEAVLAGLRDAFLTTMGAPPPRLSPTQRDRAESVAGSMSPAAMTRAMETLGTALVEMRQAPDPRVDLEVALVRLCRPAADRSMDALSDRVEQLERRLAGADPGPSIVALSEAAPPVSAAVSAVEPPETQAQAPAPTVDISAGHPPEPPIAPTDTESTPPPVPIADPTPESPADDSGSGPAAAARRALAEKRGDPSPSPSAPPSPPPIEPPPVPGISSVDPSQPAASSPSTPEPSPPSAPPPVPADPVIAAVPDPASEAGSDPDLYSIVPISPTEVVQLAGLHLGFDRSYVVNMATEVLGPAAGKRSPDELIELWQILVAEYDAVRDSGEEPTPVDLAPVELTPVASADPEPPMIASDGDPGPTPPDDDVDVYDLVDAPSHTDQIIERLTEAFPGAELHVNEPSEDR